MVLMNEVWQRVRCLLPSKPPCPPVIESIIQYLHQFQATSTADASYNTCNQVSKRVSKICRIRSCCYKPRSAGNEIPRSIGIKYLKRSALGYGLPSYDDSLIRLRVIILRTGTDATEKQPQQCIIRPRPN